MRPSGLDPGLDGGPRVVHVDVDVPQPVPADDDERVPERVEPAPQPVHGGVLGVQEVDHLVRGPLGGGLAGGVVGRCGGTRADEVTRGAGAGAGRSFAGEGLDQGVEDGDEAAAAGVDHSGAGEDREVPGCLAEGGEGGVVGGAGDGGAVGRAGGVRPVGGGGGDGQDGALDGVGDGPVGGVRRAAQGPGEERAVGVGGVSLVTRRGEDLGHAAQQLGEDRAGVAARPDERPVGHGAYRVGEGGPGGAGLVGGEDGLDRLGGGLDGQVEVGAGVAVGHRIDVDGVDVLAGAAQGGEGEGAPAADGGGVQQGASTVRGTLMRGGGRGPCGLPFRLGHLRLLVQLDCPQRRPDGPGGRGRGLRHPW